MKTITWKKGSAFNADAEKCYNEIQEIGESYTPDDVLERAKDVTSELHKCFDWDDSIAAYKWRKHTARLICNSIVLTVVEADDEPPKQFRLIHHDDEEKAYQPAVKFFTNPDKYSRLMERMREDAQKFIDRYESLPEAADIIMEMRKVI